MIIKNILVVYQELFAGETPFHHPSPPGNVKKTTDPWVNSPHQSSMSMDAWESRGKFQESRMDRIWIDMVTLLMVKN